jgi:O-acetyl-ADP-ribose deacetylase (regulator of RNase III)
MANFIAKLLEQPYWVITLVFGVGLVGLPYVTIDKDHLDSHTATTLVPAIVGIGLLLISTAGFAFSVFASATNLASGGVDLTRVKETDGMLWATVDDCEIRIINGRIDEYSAPDGSAIALPCNEYFNDECAHDPRSALGAYAKRHFEGQIDALLSLAEEECRRVFGQGVQQQKTPDSRAESFGPGRCVLLAKPLGRSTPVALVSTTTQRAGQGLAGRISYLFDGMRELVVHLGDARINEVAMPLLGAGHGGVSAPLALVGLLLAIAEAARYGRGQRLKKVTIVVFKSDEGRAVRIDPVVVRRALALIAS